MNSILQQNKQLRQALQKYEQQNKKLRMTNTEHQNQIEHLLNFNERLLNIIQSQFEVANSQIDKKQSQKPDQYVSIQKQKEISTKTQQQGNISFKKNSNSIQPIFIENKKQGNKQIMQIDSLMCQSDIVSNQISNNQDYITKTKKTTIKRLASLAQKSQKKLLQSVEFDKQKTNRNESIEDIRKLISMYRAETKDVAACHNIEPLCQQIRQEFDSGFQNFHKIARENLVFCDNKMLQLKDLHNKIAQQKSIKRLENFLEKRGRLTKK